MTTLTEYDAPVVWLPRAMDLALQSRDDYADRATTERRQGRRRNAEAYDELALEFDAIAERFARRLAAIAPEPEPPAHLHTAACPILDCPFKPVELAVGLADACAATDDEPPTQLVPFVDWLRARLGPSLPWVPTEIWQVVGCALLTCRVVRR